MFICNIKYIAVAYNTVYSDVSRYLHNSCSILLYPRGSFKIFRVCIKLKVSSLKWLIYGGVKASGSRVTRLRAVFINLSCNPCRGRVRGKRAGRGPGSGGGAICRDDAPTSLALWMLANFSRDARKMNHGSLRDGSRNNLLGKSQLSGFALSRVCSLEMLFHVQSRLMLVNSMYFVSYLFTQICVSQHNPVVTYGSAFLYVT